MTLDEIMGRLGALGDEKVRRMNVRNGVGENQFGVKMGDIRALAKSIKANPELAQALWQTGNFEARLLAVLLMKPQSISADELEQMIGSIGYAPSAFMNHVADWLNSYVVKQHPEKEQLRRKWMETSDVMSSRAGWSLTAERVAKNPDGLDLSGLLDRIEKEMGSAPAPAQWTMNGCLAEIGIRFPEYRERAIGIGEKLGLYRDYPVSKGCTSPFAPIWIGEMVRRQG